MAGTWRLSVSPELRVISTRHEGRYAMLVIVAGKYGMAVGLTGGLEASGGLDWGGVRVSGALSPK